MRLNEPFDLTTLQDGDELVLIGPDISFGARVLKVLGHEVIVFWQNTSEGDLSLARLLGMHLGLDKMNPFGSRFAPMVLSIECDARIVLLSSDEEVTVSQELRYFRVIRGGIQIFEAGTLPEATDGDEAEEPNGQDPESRPAH